MEELLEKIKSKNFNLSREELAFVVENNNKKRFQISDDGSRIKANQGHSLKLDLELDEKTPPETLFHGTAQKNIDSILQKGLEKRQRHHVHLSADEETAFIVGKRYGKPVILKVLAGKMHQKGFKFYLSDNGVWLTDAVPVEFIEVEK